MTDAEQSRAIAAAVPGARAFNRELAPSFIDHICITSGFAPPPGSPVGEGVGASFSYCELHSASAVTTTLLAASNPVGDFHAIDPRGEMIAKARALAADGKVRNVAFHEASLEQALEMELPPFDYIVVHGVYSWVPLRERSLVLAFVRRFLKPGGAVYVTYGAKPGAARLEPFRRIFRETGRGTAMDTAQRLAMANDVYKRLVAAKAPGVANGVPPAALARLADLPPDAIGADYANEYADGLYVTEVISDFAAIDCVFAGTAEMAEQITTLLPHEPFKSVIERMPTPGGRELAKDMLLGTAYRRDVFVRGGHRLAADHRDAVLGGMAFALEQPAGSVRFDKRMPFGEMTFDNPHARLLVQALSEGPRTLGALVERAMANGSDPGAVAANIHALLLTQQIRPVYRPTAEAEQGARAMAEAIKMRALSPEAIGFLPSAFGTAFAVPVADQLFIAAGRGKPARALVQSAVEQIERSGRPPNLEELDKRARVFTRLDAYYGALGLLAS